MDNQPVLQLNGVIKEFGTRVITRVLHGINFTLSRGDFAALMGPSGSGKSTLLHLMGLLDRPTQGTIWIQGHNTSMLSEKEMTSFRGHAIGFIFQFHHLLPAFTTLENVMIPMLADQGYPNHKIRERALYLLEQVGLADKAHSKVTEISGGQQQRVAIARALALNPPLVLADEPTGNLDTHTASEVFDLLRRINQDQGTTFLVVTHDLRLTERCRRVIELVDGQICSDEYRKAA